MLPLGVIGLVRLTKKRGVEAPKDQQPKVASSVA